MIAKDSIDINMILPEVYRWAANIEEQHLYIPGYHESKIMVEADGAKTVHRIAELDGKTMKWKSKVKFTQDKKIEYVQIEGRLVGMKVLWTFEVPKQGWTRVTITHTYNLKIPLIGWLIERYKIKPIVDKMTRNTLEGLKKIIKDING